MTFDVSTVFAFFIFCVCDCSFMLDAFLSQKLRLPGRATTHICVGSHTQGVYPKQHTPWDSFRQASAVFQLELT